MAKKAVILVSGGIDSSTVLAMVRNAGYEIYAITFNYGQRHNIEIEKIKLFIKDYNVRQHKIINIDLAGFGGSALTDHDISVPKYKNVEDLKDDIPITYVPARNTIFLSYALGYAEIIGATDIFMGVHAADYSNYPDCRPEYVHAFENMANLAIKPHSEGIKIKIHTPIIEMTKAEIIAEGTKLGVDYSKTISCYDPSIEAVQINLLSCRQNEFKSEGAERTRVREHTQDPQNSFVSSLMNDAASCGTCHACLLRLEGFAKNNLQDPIKYIDK